jgi:membrane protease YdiL (CAAX protease family)
VAPSETRRRWDETAWIASLLAIFTAGTVAGWISYLFVPSPHHFDAESFSALIFVRESAALGALALFATRYLKISSTDLGITRVRLPHVLVGVAAAVAFVFTISPILDRFLPPPAHNVFAEVLANSTTADRLIYFAIIGVYSPIIQELVFRGLLLTGLLQRTNVVVAILLSSLLFALSHMQNGVRATMSAFFFGIVVGSLYTRLRSLSASIACHIAINSTFVSVSPVILHSNHH